MSPRTAIVVALAGWALAIATALVVMDFDVAAAMTSPIVAIVGFIALAAIVGNAAGRTALLMQLSARPWALDGALVAGELQAMAGTTTIDALIHDLTTGPEQKGTHSAHPVVIGWRRQDRLLFPAQAARAVGAFPGARLHWFDRSGHFPAWDEPEATAAMIRGALG